MELTYASLIDACPGRAGRLVWPRCSCRANITGPTQLPVSPMRRGIQFPRRQPAHRAHDVVFSLKVLKEKGHPIVRQLLRDFAGAHAPGRCGRDRELRIGPRPRLAAIRLFAADFLARLLCGAPIRGDDARHRRWAAARTRSGNSGPGRFIEYERVKDWWGTDLPVGRGQNKLDVIR